MKNRKSLFGNKLILIIPFTSVRGFMASSSSTETGFRLWQQKSRTESYPRPVNYSISPTINENPKKSENPDN